MDGAGRVPVPGVVPAPSHVAVDGVPDTERLESVHEGTERKVPCAVDDAEASADLAEGPVAVRPVRLETALEAFLIIIEKTLAEAHATLPRGFLERRAGILMAEIVIAGALCRGPCEHAVVRPAVEPFVELAAGNVVPGDIRVLECRELLPRKGRGAAENHGRIRFRRHGPGRKIHPREARIINGQAVAADNLDRRGYGSVLRG